MIKCSFCDNHTIQKPLAYNLSDSNFFVNANRELSEFDSAAFFKCSYCTNDKIKVYYNNYRSVIIFDNICFFTNNEKHDGKIMQAWLIFKLRQSKNGKIGGWYTIDLHDINLNDFTIINIINQTKDQMLFS